MAYGLWLSADTLIFHQCRVTPLHIAGKTRKEVAQMDPTEIIPVEINPVLICRKYATATRHCGPTDSRVVVEDRANADDRVCPIDDFAGAWSTDLTPVDAGELRMNFRKEALCGGHDGDGAAEC